MSSSVYVVMVGIVLVAMEAVAEPHALPSSPATRPNSTTAQDEFVRRNGTDSAAVESHISTILRDLPTIKNIVIFVCVLTTLLIIYLVIKVYRSGRKIQKTRKYEIITTSAERVEMAPLNGDNEDDDDATLFDVKYS